MENFCYGVMFNLFLFVVICRAENNNITREFIPLQAPENLTLINFEDKEVLIKWEPVEPASVRGTFRGYVVRVWNHGFSQVYAIPPEVTKTAVQFFPFSKNFITVSVRNDKYVGPRSNAISFDAPQIEPGMVYLFEKTQLGSNSAFLQWNKPKQTNGVLLGYNIYCSETQDFGINEKTTVTYFIQGPDNLQAKLTGLREGLKYQVEIGAVNCAGEGEHNTLEIEVEPHTPYPPSIPSFKYKINYNITDPKQEFHWKCSRVKSPFQSDIKLDDFDDDFYILNGTTGKIVTPKPASDIQRLENHEPCLVNTLITWIPDVTKNPGDHFYVKYRMRGEKEWKETAPETDEDYVILENFNGCRSYEIILVAVDGEFETESELQETPAVMFMFRQK